VTATHHAHAISQASIAHLLECGDIVRLIDARVPLRQKGRHYVACCPFHVEKTASFTVNAQKQLYYCFGCKIGGNAINFLMEYERLPFREAVLYLAQQWNFTLDYEFGAVTTAQNGALYRIMERAAQYYQQQLIRAPHALNYLAQRQVSTELIKTFGIGYAPAVWDALAKTVADTQTLLTAGLILKKSRGHYDRFRDRIMFPIRDRQGRILAFGGRVLTTSTPKYLNSPETPIFHKRSELYGFYEACQKRPYHSVVVVEGYLDVLALVHSGIVHTVATLGSAMSSEQILRLFSVFPEVILCFDGDKAGQAAAWRALEVSLPIFRDGWSLKFLTLPSEHDPDSWVKQQGAAHFQRALLNAQAFEHFLFDHLVQRYDRSTVSGKAGLAKNALQLIKKIPIGVTQHQLLRQLAQCLDMDLASLEQVTAQAKKIPANLPISKKSSKSTPYSGIKLATILLIQYPHLGHCITEEDMILLRSVHLSEYALFVELIQKIASYTQVSTAVLLESWRDQADYDRLQQYAHSPITLPEHCLATEFQGIIMHLKKQAIRLRIDALLQKAKQSGLDLDEKKQLARLLS